MSSVRVKLEILKLSIILQVFCEQDFWETEKN